VLTAAAFVSSAMRGFFTITLPEGAFGETTAAETVSVMPENPVLKIYVPQKDENEQRQFVQMQYQTPVPTGSPLEWVEKLCIWQSSEVIRCAWEIPLYLEFEGKMDVEVYRNGVPHYWNNWFGKPDGFLPDEKKLQWWTGDTMHGSNELSVLINGGWRDTYSRTREGYSSPSRTLAQKIGGELPAVYSTIRQYTDESEIRIVCRDVLDESIAAKAVLRLTCVSYWENAGSKCRLYRHENGQAILIGHDDNLLHYAKVKPTWTLEVVEYWERAE